MAFREEGDALGRIPKTENQSIVGTTAEPRALPLQVDFVLRWYPTSHHEICDFFRQPLCKDLETQILCGNSVNSGLSFEDDGARIYTTTLHYAT